MAGPLPHVNPPLSPVNSTSVKTITEQWGSCWRRRGGPSLGPVPTHRPSDLLRTCTALGRPVINSQQLLRPKLLEIPGKATRGMLGQMFDLASTGGFWSVSNFIQLCSVSFSRRSRSLQVQSVATKCGFTHNLGKAKRRTFLSNQWSSLWMFFFLHFHNFY